MGFKPIVVINKIDKPLARPDWVLIQAFDLFVNLDATDEQLDFDAIYAFGVNGLDDSVRDGDMIALFELIVGKVSPPDVDVNGPFCMQVSSLDCNSRAGAIGVGRIQQVTGFLGLQREGVVEAQAGDIIALTGLDPSNISDILCDPDAIEVLPTLTVGESTVTMMFQVNNSPFAG